MLSRLALGALFLGCLSWAAVSGAAEPTGACRYAGALDGEQVLYRTSSEMARVATFSDAHGTFVVPEKVGKGARVPLQVTYPLEVAGYVENAPPLKLRSRLDVVKGYVWLPAGTAVRTFHRAGDGVRVDIALQGEEAAALSPRRIVRTLDCDELTLDSPDEPEAQPEVGENSMWLLSGRVTLHDNRRNAIASFASDDGVLVTELERRRGWVRIFMTQPFHANAWVRSSVVAEAEAIWGNQEISAGGSWETTVGVHVATARTAVRGAAATDAPVVAHLAPGALVHPGADEGEFVEVLVPGVAVSEDRNFYVSKSDFERRFAAQGELATSTPSRVAEWLSATWQTSMASAYIQARREVAAGRIRDAAETLEGFGRRDTSSLGVEALGDAMALWLVLDQPGRATRLTESVFPGTPGAELRRHFVIAQWYAEREEWAEVLARLERNTERFDKGAPFDVLIRSKALLGRAHGRTGNVDAATRAYAEVVRLYSDPIVVRQRVFKDGSESRGVPSSAWRYVLTVDAVGEALFYQADRLAQRALAARMPEYTGDHSAESAKRYREEQLAPWLSARKEGLERVDEAYLRLLTLNPISPRWVIAAGARVGAIYADTVRQFRAMPSPEVWDVRTVREIKQAYHSSHTGSSGPNWKARARAAYTVCLDRAVWYQISNDDSVGCEAWLAKHYKYDFSRTDEFVARPTRRRTQALGRPVALR